MTAPLRPVHLSWPRAQRSIALVASSTLVLCLLAALLALATTPTSADAHEPTAVTAASARADRQPGIVRVGDPGLARRHRALSVGVQFHGTWGDYSDPERARVLNRLVRMGATWVRIDISWATIQPERGRISPSSWGVQYIDHVISMAHRRGLKVLGTLWLSPAWASSRGERSVPDRPAMYGRAFGWVARHWRKKVQAWEVWNEPNSTDFFQNAGPRGYTRMLCSAYRNAHRRAPRVEVVYGGPMHNDTSWISRTYRAGARGCFDVMAVHPYQVPANTGPNSGDGADEWEFKHLGAVRRVMRRHHDRSPVWATELGWSAHRNPNGGEPWELGVSQRKQARFTVQAFKMMTHRYPWLDKVFLYNERSAGETRHLRGYGILTRRLKPRKVYFSIKRWLH